MSDEKSIAAIDAARAKYADAKKFRPVVLPRDECKLKESKIVGWTFIAKTDIATFVDRHHYSWVMVDGLVFDDLCSRRKDATDILTKYARALEWGGEVEVMIEICTGDLFTSGAHTLVNPVNCVGVMGAGLAKQFKSRYPDMYPAYRKACNAGRLKPGSILPGIASGQRIVHVATKRHWRDASFMSWIEEGLANLADHVKHNEVPSIAIPPVGCGLGGLDFRAVFYRINDHFRDLPTRTMIYVPNESAAWARSIYRVLHPEEQS
jgi:O-acetyl-ADP-ribose deacetylase (regulator of RNase III)